MLQVKGTGLVNLRKIMASREKTFEDSFLAQLDHELNVMYQASLFTTMNPVDKQFQIYKLAAKMIFPDESIPMRKFGKLLAEKSFTGLYKLFIRIPTTSFIISKVPAIWKRYFSEGDATMENITKQSAELVVTDMPTFPVFMLEYASGMIEFLLEQTGVTQTQIKIIDTDPNAWNWKISWE